MDNCFGTPLLLLAIFLFAAWRAGIFKRHRHHYVLRCVRPFGMRPFNPPSAFYQCTQCAKSVTLPAHRKMVAGLDYPPRPPAPKGPPPPKPHYMYLRINGSGENAEYVRHVDPYRNVPPAPPTRHR